MLKKVTFIILLLFAQNIFSQEVFKKGYFINNDNEKNDCLIKINSRLNPDKFTYKNSNDAEQQIQTIKSVKEFGIYNTSKYIRKTVNIDISSDILSKISNDKNPTLNKEELFLKVLIEGNANLYLFETKSLIRYFYNKGNSEILQLIYKRYKKENEEIISKNQEYKRQLWNNLKCESISINDVNKLDYKKTELINFFIKYNECKKSKYIRFENTEKKDLFNITLRPGFNSSSLSIYEAITRNRTDIGNDSGFRFGIEAEFIINSIKDNKWSVFIEPTYQSYKSKLEWQGSTQKYFIDVSYTSIEIPIGIRHYFSLNDESKIFINGAILLDLPLNPSIDFNFSPGYLDAQTTFNFALGAGFKFNDKYSLEARYLTNRNLLWRYQGWSSKYQTLSIVLGYALF
ncbi:tRNA modification GTPase [Thalassobellus sediminis]|uniref:tRNA modification GTPase n=1 Tax=Thalassobellus sediminis TaxID=3367753 RepID=UPI0037B0B3AB